MSKTGPMLMIERNYTSKEASEWLTGLVFNVFEHLDFETCIGLLNGEVIEDELTEQVESLSRREADGIVVAALLALTSND